MPILKTDSAGNASHPSSDRPRMPVSRDQLDYTVIEDGREIGRMYEDRSARPELRWFWSIVVFVGSRPGIATHGRTATIEEAKAQFLRNWNLVNGKKE
jgi:hypothetical protein